MKIVFATNNPNKLKEIQSLIPKEIEIISLKEIGCNEDIPETGDTLEANAFQKAHYIKDNFNYDCFADDTGLEIDELNGDPGVYSARYAGPERNANANMNKVLNELKGKKNRKAQFRTAIALTLNNEEHLFEGKVEGYISKENKVMKVLATTLSLFQKTTYVALHKCLCKKKELSATEEER